MGGARIWSGVAIAAAMLLAPAAAAHAATLDVENGAIRYVGDDGPNDIEVFPVENGEQSIYATNVKLGSGCRERPPEQGYSNGNILCSRAGVDRVEITTGGGDDTFSGTLLSLDIPVHADMGDGNDRTEFGSTQNDVITTGDGNDFVLDGMGDDTIDLGPGNDVVPTADFSTGNDTINGGEGDDNIDGNAGNDTIYGGPGNDLFQPSEGNDTLYGEEGDDEIGGAGTPVACSQDPGNDFMIGGLGDDKICGGPGHDTIDGGWGNDSLNAVDQASDAPLFCGPGADAVWADPSDPIAPDCELRDDGRTVALPKPNVLPVTLPCGRCEGTVSVFATPRAPSPNGSAFPPLTPPKTAGKALGRPKKFRVNASFALPTVKIKLGKAEARRLRKLGATTVEARARFTQEGTRYVVRRTFRIKPRQ
jgi:hypothetical protein